MSWRTVRIIVGILVFVIAFGVVTTLVSRPEKTTKEISDFAFSVGGIDENGKYEKRNDTIYTKNRISALDLTVTPNYTFKGKYKIFFYDGKDNLIMATNEIEDVYCVSDSFLMAPDNAYFYARIMILPELDDGDKINFLEPVKYSSQLKIENSKKGFKITGDLLNNAEIRLNPPHYQNNADPTVTLPYHTMYSCANDKYDYFIFIGPSYSLESDMYKDGLLVDSLLKVFKKVDGKIEGEFFSFSYLDGIQILKIDAEDVTSVKVYLHNNHTNLSDYHLYGVNVND